MRQLGVLVLVAGCDRVLGLERPDAPPSIVCNEPDLESRTYVVKTPKWGNFGEVMLSPAIASDDDRIFFARNGGVALLVTGLEDGAWGILLDISVVGHNIFAPAVSADGGTVFFGKRAGLMHEEVIYWDRSKSIDTRAAANFMIEGKKHNAVDPGSTGRWAGRHRMVVAMPDPATLASVPARNRLVEVESENLVDWVSVEPLTIPWSMHVGGIEDVESDLSPDGCHLVFVSNRGSGSQDTDIYISTRDVATGKFPPPTRLMKTVTTDAERAPTFGPDGRFWFLRDIIGSDEQSLLYSQ